MYYQSTSGTLVQVIYILSDNLHIVKTLQFCKKFMSQAWLNIKHLLATLVIKLCNEFWITLPPLWSGNILNPILLPQSSAIAEGADTALGTHAGTGKDYDFLSLHITKK